MVIGVIVVLGFVCVICEICGRLIGVSSVRELLEYAYVFILPQITQITQRGMQQAALFRRERQVVASRGWG